MRKYYQPKGGKAGRYALRENTYRRIWYLIADYKYFKCIQAGIAESEYWRGRAEDQGRPYGNGKRYPGPGTATAAEKQAGYAAEAAEFDPAQISRYIKAIEDAQKKVPAAYVDYIMEHITGRMKYKDMENVSERTMKLWVQRFIWLVARNLGEI